jgi:hypothetical protein
MLLRLKYLFVGAIAFFTPGLILTATLRRELDGWMYIVLPCVSVLVAYFFVSQRRQESVDLPAVAPWMLLGIHMLGAWFAMFENTFLGAGFHAMRTWSDWKYLLLLSLPLLSWIAMPLYFLALIFVTLFLIVAQWGKGFWIACFRQKQTL